MMLSKTQFEGLYSCAEPFRKNIEPETYFSIVMFKIRPHEIYLDLLSSQFPK